MARADSARMHRARRELPPMAADAGAARYPRTKDGKYTCRAIEQVGEMPFRITPEERDYAWDFWFNREKWLREHGRATV